jgi:hypothetical protein
MASTGKVRNADFSRKAISRAVLKQTTQHPSVLYPAGAAIIGGLAAVAMGPGVVVLGAIIGGGAIALGGWAINQVMRRDYFANRYVTQLREQLLNRHQVEMANIQQGLTELGNDIGLAQLRRVQEKFDAFKIVLSSKLQETELTHGRYLGIAEQVYFAVLDNLSRVVGVSRSMAAIDVDYTVKRLRELEALESRDSAEQLELDTQVDRMKLAEEQNARIKNWLAANEHAMTQLDHAAMTLAAIETTRGLAKVDLETSMAEMQRLAKATALYDRDNLKH